jgi:peptide-methionine (S)-S-oxide reductase
VVRTRVGYAGGDSQNPTYRNIGDQSETIQIDYDPALISYEELLALFWGAHSPISPSSSSQYASIIHYGTDEEKLLAEQSMQAQEEVLGKKIYTEIIPLGEFTLAEDYHQKYYLQNRNDLMSEFSAIYPDIQDFINSTAAARANGYVGRNGSLEMLEAEIDSLGLSDEGQEELLRYFK